MGGGSNKDLSPLQNIALGCSAGTIEVVILQPMLYCKNATQQKLPLTLNPAVLYRGITVSIGNMALITGLQFPLTGMVSSVMTGGADRPLSSSEKIAAGFAGGAISGVVCAPMELIMIQQQRFGGSFLEAGKRIISGFGVSTLFRGLLTSCGREGCFTAGYLGLGPVFAGKILEQKPDLSQGIADFAGAAGAGVIAASLSHPMDTIKTCMQGDIERKTFGSLAQTSNTLLAEDGIGRFFKGWSWRTSRMICAIFIMGQCKTKLGPLMFPEKERR